MTDPARTITIPISSALRIAELLDYMCDLSEHAEDHLDSEEHEQLVGERTGSRYWIGEIRDAVRRTGHPPAP